MPRSLALAWESRSLSSSCSRLRRFSSSSSALRENLLLAQTTLCLPVRGKGKGKRPARRRISMCRDNQWSMLVSSITRCRKARVRLKQSQAKQTALTATFRGNHTLTALPTVTLAWRTLTLVDTCRCRRRCQQRRRSRSCRCKASRRWRRDTIWQRRTLTRFGFEA